MHTFKQSQLFHGEKPMEATLSDGRKVTVLTKSNLNLYCAPGRPGNFGGVGDTVMPEQHFFFTKMKDGRSVQIQLNQDTGSLCISVVHGNFGREWRVDLGNMKSGTAFRLDPM